MTSRKVNRKLEDSFIKIFQRVLADRDYPAIGGQSKDGGENRPLKSNPPRSVEDVSAATLPNTPPQPPKRSSGQTEGASEDAITCSSNNIGDHPDLSWIKKWQQLDLKSAIASELEFFETDPRFDGDEGPVYILFYQAVQGTKYKAEKANTLAEDDTALENYRMLGWYLADFLDRSRWLLLEALSRINHCDYGQCGSLKTLKKIFQGHQDFLSFTKEFAFSAEMGDEWTKTLTFVHGAIRRLREGNDALATISNSQILPSHTLADGPLSPELLKMDYEFTTSVWAQWISGCMMYFAYWTADPRRQFPAKDFIRHLSHYRLAMELFLRHGVLSEREQSMLQKLVRAYLDLFRRHTARKLEIKYVRLKNYAEKASLYLTEAKFWHLADDIEVLLNEPPAGISTDTWDAAVPSMFSKDIIWGARNAVNTLYKEFHIKQYPENEVAYLWLLTWRNIKHTIPYMTSPEPLAAIGPDAEESTITIEPRDLALPFVEKNLSQLLFLICKDNDALYQKEIETLVGYYCAHIDNYVKGTGEGQGRVYAQFFSLSNTKPVPYAYLVSLEKYLLKQLPRPTNDSQMVAHRVAKRLNHLLEGPKEFTRWYATEDGLIQTYSPSFTCVEEQRALQQKGGFEIVNSSQISPPLSYDGPSQSLAAGTGTGVGAGASNGGSDQGKRIRLSGHHDQPISTDEDIEEVAPNGTKRKIKRKRAQRTTESTIAAPSTQDTLDDPKESTNLSHLGSMEEVSTSRANKKDEERSLDAVVPGLHPSPSDSLAYHRVRLRVFRVEETSAVPNAQYPLPETAAPERAAALQIARELADPGIFSDGPRPEDVQKYINPALRLPLAGVESTRSRQEQITDLTLIRRGLVKLRDTLTDRFFSTPPRHSRPRPTPDVPVPSAQHRRHEQEERGARASILKRQPDQFSVSKTPPRNARPRSSPRLVLSIDGSTSQITESDDWQEASAAGSTETNNSNASTVQIDKTSFNRWSATRWYQENQQPAAGASPIEGDGDDWNSPSPPHRNDPNIYYGSPQQAKGTPTPIRPVDFQRSSGSRLPVHSAPGTEATANGQNGSVVDASPPAPLLDHGPNPHLRGLDRWIRLELASGNPNMRTAHQQFLELVKTQVPATLTYLYELLRAEVELNTFNNYRFERHITFGSDAGPNHPLGVPNTIAAPKTPPLQMYRDKELWWNDPLEGTRECMRRSAAAWSEPPPEEGQCHTQARQREPRVPDILDEQLELVLPPSRRTDQHGDVLSWNGSDQENQPYGDTRRGDVRNFEPHPDNGLSLREFSIYINPDNRVSAPPHPLGEPLLVDDPQMPGQLIPNPNFNPEVARLISAAGTDDRGVININVPPGWHVNVLYGGERFVRSGAPSVSERGSGSDPSRHGSQVVTIGSPRFQIYEDSPLRGKLRGRSQAPPELGLLPRPPLRDLTFEQVIIEDSQPDPTHSSDKCSEGTNDSFPSTPTKVRGASRDGFSDSLSPHFTSTSSSKSSAENNSGLGTSKSPSRPSPRIFSSPAATTTTTTTATSTPATGILPPSSRPRGSRYPATPAARSARRGPSRSVRSGTEPATPWYLQWQTSSVARLRTELRSRGIPLTGLGRKQAMIDRLKTDDEVEGFYSPSRGLGDGDKETEYGKFKSGREAEEEKKKKGEKVKSKKERGDGAVSKELKKRRNPFQEDEGKDVADGNKQASPDVATTRTRRIKREAVRRITR